MHGGATEGCTNGSSLGMTTSAPMVGKKRSIVMLIGCMQCVFRQLGLTWRTPRIPFLDVAFISYEMQMQVSTVVIVSLRVCIY